jgi:hypothetical protein
MGFFCVDHKIPAFCDRCLQNKLWWEFAGVYFFDARLPIVVMEHAKVFAGCGIFIAPLWKFILRENRKADGGQLIQKKNQ